MELYLIELLKPYTNINIEFQKYLLKTTNGNGNFIEFAKGLSWRMQLGMILEFLDIIYDITISIFPKGGAIIKTINDRQYIVDTFISEDLIHPLERYYKTIDKAFNYLTNPF